MSFIGRSGGKAFFLFDSTAVVVDEDSKEVLECGLAYTVLASAESFDASSPANPIIEELAVAAVLDMSASTLSSNERLYTIPKAVQAEAKRALEWRKEHNRGGTPVGLNSARRLSAGGQIGIQKVRHIAKYFPRHEVDKKGKGYKPGEPNFPSNGRIAWALWGGDAGERWASAIVERENKKLKNASIIASYDAPERYELDSFWRDEMPSEVSPEFIIRVRLDGTGIDRLYKIEPSGEVAFWDDGAWDNLGNIEHDFKTYDKTLDDVYDDVDKAYVPIDIESAIKLSALLDNCPFCSYSVADIDRDEAQYFADEVDSMNWEFVDKVMTAAGEGGNLRTSTPPANQDGNYTPEERSVKAQGQVRNASGEFAKDGSRVIIGNNPKAAGFIKSVNPADSSVTVQLDAGGPPVNIPAKTTTLEADYKPIPQQQPVESNIDTSGIIGQPRTPIDQPNAHLPGTLPPLNSKSVGVLINDWGAWVADQRLAPELPTTATPTAPKPKGPLGQNAYNDPFLRDWLDEKYKNKQGQTIYPNRGWYNPKKLGVDVSGIEKKKSASEVNKIDKKELLKPSWARTTPVKASADAPKPITPDTSDVAPLYMAIVAPDDPQAVLDLVSLVPESGTSIKPSTFRWENGEWLADNQILADLNSPTPPPIVVLDDDMLKSVLDQIGSTKPISASLINELDQFIDAMIAAGGLDRNSGGAEKLRRYWLYGKGAAKIRWNTPGDWTRCTRQLSKYMGPRAKGYCALRHKEATGMWTGDKEHRQMYGKNVFSNEILLSEQDIIDNQALIAMAANARRRVLTADAGASEELSKGAAFTIPLVIPEGVESGDGRIFEKDAIEMRELPLPLLWQIKTAEGHSGSVVVGQIVSMEKTDQGIGNARGFFDTGEFGTEAERLVRGGFLHGVSADLDKFEADEELEEAGDKSNKKIGSGKINITKARVMAVTIVPKPAFQECKISLDEEVGRDQEETVIPDGIYVEDMDALEASALLACGLVAGSIPVTPPKSWFDNPGLDKATPLTVDDEGRVFGHIAAWHVDHIGMSFGTRPPRSRSNYAYFHTGVVRTDDGIDIPVGQLTLAGGHASLEASASEASRHYDDTASAIADVHAGEDSYGIWVAGALRPGASPEQVRALRASAPSGDWRPIKGKLELVAVCQVNVPGFPIARARVASGQVMALVAAGANMLARMKSDPLADLNNRIQKLETTQKAPLVAAAEEARSRVLSAKAEQTSKRFNKSMTEFSAKNDLNKKISKQFSIEEMLLEFSSEDGEFGAVSSRVRQALAKEGKALPDGSFPIRNESDLKNAVQAYGRSKPGKRASVRRHIIKQARKLDRKDLVPETWKEASEMDELVASLYARIPVLAAAPVVEEVLYKPVIQTIDPNTGEPVQITGDQNRPKYTPKTQPRDTKGKFRDVLARLKVNLGVAGSQGAMDKIQEVENLDNVGNYIGASKAATDLLDIINRLDSGALNKDSLENIRTSSGELGKVIANLPFAFGNENEKIRFSDMPPALRDLVEDMMKKVEAKIGKEDAAVANQPLKDFKSGLEVYNQSEISSQLSKLLRLLT